MSTNHTTNYNLNQWEATDKVLRTEFNEDNSKIDAALNSLASQVAGKAAQSAVTALTQTVSGKADQSALNSLTQTVNGKANQADLTALSQTVAGKADQADVDALTAKAGTQLIKRVTLSETAEYYHFDLTDIDWSQWSTVTIRLKPTLVTGDTFRFYLYMGNVAPQLTYNPIPLAVLHLFPLFDETSKILGLFFPGNHEGNGLQFDYTYSQIKKLELSPEESDFLAGSVFEVWGNK